MSSTRARLLLSLAAILLAAGTLYAVQAIKETVLITSSLRQNTNIIKRLYRISHNMRQKARPFGNPRHRVRFRFDPGTREGREVLTLSRDIRGQLALLKGILCHAPVPKKNEIIMNMYKRSESLGVFAKRSLRAVRDGNYALYLASAQAIEKETRLLDETMYRLENMINASIKSTDHAMEDL